MTRSALRWIGEFHLRHPMFVEAVAGIAAFLCLFGAYWLSGAMP